MNTGFEVGAALASRRAFGGIGRDAVVAKLLRKTAAPLAQGGLANIETLAVLADGLHHDMHVRMSLVCMQSQGVSVLQRELLAYKVAAGEEQFAGISSLRHG